MTKTAREPFEGIVTLPGFPLVLVTVDRNIMTAAAFSFYSFSPPCIMVGIRPENLTFELISEQGEFGVNIPTAAHLEAVRICGSVSGREAEKFEKAGLTPQRGSVIDSFLIAECPVNIECRVVHQVQFGGTHTWFVGEIVAAHVDGGYSRDQALTYWMQEYRSVGQILCKVERK
ncbi:MAG: flavin reductase family protein [Anaerolineae bacterium]|jgi:flavin reductase (DIM6/NTAB) family NADH-FMN oxidoreductase RutF